MNPWWITIREYGLLSYVNMRLSRFQTWKAVKRTWCRLFGHPEMVMWRLYPDGLSTVSCCRCNQPVGD